VAGWIGFKVILQFIARVVTVRDRLSGTETRDENGREKRDAGRRIIGVKNNGITRCRSKLLPKRVEDSLSPLPRAALLARCHAVRNGKSVTRTGGALHLIKRIQPSKSI
jgi:hypothetical protein